MQRLARCVALFMLVASGTVLAADGIAPDWPVDGPLTLDIEWDWGERATWDRAYAIDLTTDPDTDLPHISLIWDRDPTSWLPSWRLQLHVRESGSGQVRVLPLFREVAPDGVRAATRLSLYPDGSGLAIAATQEAQQSTGVMQGVASALPDGPWYVRTSFEPGRGPQLHRLSVAEGYRPVADRFEIGELTDSGTFIRRTSFPHSGLGYVRIHSTTEAPGSYRLSLRGDDGPLTELHLATIHPMQGTRDVEIPLGKLPLGPVTLLLEYIDDGRVVYTQEQQAVIGSAHMKFDVVDVRADSRHLLTHVTIDAADSLVGVDVDLMATFSELEWTGDAFEPVRLHELSIYTGDLNGLLDHSPMSLMVPFPELGGPWRVDFAATTHPRIQLHLEGTREMFADRSKRDDHQIAITDQGSQRIVVLDPEVKDWNGSAPIVWTWYPNEANGFPSSSPGWGNPSDAKLRKSEVWGGEWALIVDSKGFAAIVPYPEGGTPRWHRIIQGNLHSAELLPNGNLAIAASTGGFVRVYTSSSSTDPYSFTEYRLAGAHGLQWDPACEVLWALGDHVLAALRVVGSADRPVLELVSESALPTPWGHDLSPVYGDPGRLWVTTGSRVYQYEKATGRWIDSFLGAEGVTRLVGVKGIGNQPSGRIVYSQAKDGGLYTWATDTVSFALPSEARVINGAAIYKARIWSSQYQ